MSDFTEYAQFYKKAWEQTLGASNKEAEERGFQKAINALLNYPCEREDYVNGDCELCQTREYVSEWLSARREKILKGNT
jgi:hypothetical protein